MRLRAASLGLLLGTLMCIPTGYGAGRSYGSGSSPSEPPGTWYKDQILRFVGNQEVTMSGHKRLAVAFAPLKGSGQMITYVAYKDKTYETDEGLEATVTHLKKDDVVNVDLEQQSGIMTIKKIKLIEVKPGEETPHGFVYQESYNNPAGAAVVRVTKYGMSYEMPLQTIPDEKGQPQPDPDLLSAAETIKLGQVVYIQATPGKVPVVQVMFPYREASTGKVVKVSEQEVTGGKTQQIDIETSDGKTVSALVPGKVMNKRFTPDVALARLVHGFKPGTEVEFLSRDSNGKSYLVEISKAAPAPKAGKPEMSSANTK